MAEWLKAVASKAIIPGNWNRGFESPSLHTTPSPLSHAIRLRLIAMENDTARGYVWQAIFLKDKY